MLVTPPCDSDHPRGSRSTIVFDVRNWRNISISLIDRVLSEHRLFTAIIGSPPTKTRPSATGITIGYDSVRCTGGYLPAPFGVIGANMGCKLFVALQLEVSHHFIERCAGGSTRRFKPPATFGATKTQKMLLLNPYQRSVHGRPLRESATVCGIHLSASCEVLENPPCLSVCDCHHISPLVEVSTEQRNRHCCCNIAITLTTAHPVPLGQSGNSQLV
jgi:hypothetical protein